MKYTIALAILFTTAVAYANSFTYRNVNSNDGAPLNSNSPKLNALRCMAMQHSSYHYDCSGDTCMSRTGNNSNPRKLQAKNCANSHYEGGVLVRKCDLLRDSIDSGDLYYRPAGLPHEGFHTTGAYSICFPGQPALELSW